MYFNPTSWALYYKYSTALWGVALTQTAACKGQKQRSHYTGINQHQYQQWYTIYMTIYSFRSETSVSSQTRCTILSVCVMSTFFSPQNLPPTSRSSLSPFQWKLSPLVQISMLCLRNRLLAPVVSWNGITLRWPSGRTTPLKVSLETIIWMMRFCESSCKKIIQKMFSKYIKPQCSICLLTFLIENTLIFILKNFEFVTF